MSTPEKQIFDEAEKFQRIQRTCGDENKQTMARARQSVQGRDLNLSSPVAQRDGIDTMKLLRKQIL
jgi:hypothetical protein